MGHLVEISVNWPARLGGTCPLQFVAMGKVTRSETGQAAVRIERYEFKTRSATGLNGPNGLNSLCAAAGSRMF
jgi:hypothetical protein